MAIDRFTFMPLKNSDLELLCDWLEKPHVLEWWNDHLTREEIKEKYGKRIGDDVVCPYIAYLNNKPIGFIQYYYANKVGDGWWPNEVGGTVGIDQFIGEADFINRGYGTHMIEQFLVKLFSDPAIKKIITDPDKNNRRAIRCYEKVGFCFSHETNTPEGSAWLMNRYRNTNIEPHAALLKKPNEKTLLYKILSSDNFFNMIENNYLYFKKVDTYSDDKRDSDQPDKNKEASEKSKFEKSPEFTARHYYDSCRAKTYACCFSTENTPHIWSNYGGNDPNSVCLVFDCHKLINFINLIFDESSLLYVNQKLLKNFFYLNHGLVTYGDFDNVFLREKLPNPIEYVYFKNAIKYSPEREFRISLSCLGIYKKYVLSDKSEFNFPESITLEFNFVKAIQMKIIKEIIVSHQCTDKEIISTKLNNLLGEKGITIKFK